MAALTLRIALLMASLIHHAGAKCIYSWSSPDFGPIGLCSLCSGFCYENNGCYCSDGLTSCLPDGNVQCAIADLTLCCPLGLYYNQTSSCCTETSICVSECATDEVCAMGVCVCNSSIYQDKTGTDFHPALSCDINVMMVTASQCLLSSLGYDPASIHLRNSSQSCNFPFSSSIHGQKVIVLPAIATPGWCGNIATEEGSRLFVTNTIDIGAPVNSNITASPISFNITCPLFTGTYPLARTVVISGSNGMRLIPLTMAAYKDPQFVTPYVSNEIVLGSEIYVALYIYPTDGDTYVLRLQDCTASPTDDPNTTKALHLISQGCATDSLTQIIQNGNSREVRMKIGSSQFQDFTTVYLFCDARLCVKSGEECTACKESQSFSMGVTQLQLDLRLKGNSQQLEQRPFLGYGTLYGGSPRAAIVGLWYIIWWVT
ncbi:pancreatic secretory granule membrane major glycoprotein GP2-like [Aquarana catesbeiana]|uniref:pancreatic secretory granule membrane major glycoprotein GP2-like n=1 Tax=Aquarana catesbeiana TaxID=8400 RepID=UPI003CC9D335